MNKIPLAVGQAAAVAILPPNADSTYSNSVGGMSVFAGLVLSKRGKPNSVLELTKDNYLDVLGAAIHPHEGASFESIRHVTQALSGGKGYVVRVVPKSMRIPMIRLQSTANSQAGSQTIDKTKSIFNVSPSRIAADGIVRSTITFTPKNKNGDVILGLTNISFDAVGGNVVPVFDTVAENNGVWSCRVSSQEAGTYTIRALINGWPQDGFISTLVMYPAVVSGAKSRLEVSKSTILADGKDSVTLMLYARDHAGNIITGMTNISLLVNGVGTKVSAMSEGTAGIYSATMTSTTAGQATATVTQNGAIVSNGSIPLSQTISIDSVASSTHKIIDPANSSLTCDRQDIDANGADVATVTFKPVDQNGKPVTGIADQLKFVVTNNQAGINMPNGLTESQPGEYRSTVWSSVDGLAIIAIYQNNRPIGNKVITLTLNKVNQVLDKANSRIFINNTSVLADGKTMTTLRFTAVDIAGRAMSNLKPSFVITGYTDKDNYTIANTPALEISPGSGIYETTIKSSEAGNISVFVYLDGSDSGVSFASMSFIDSSIVVQPNTPDASKSTLVAVNGTTLEAGDPDSSLEISFTARNAGNGIIQTPLNVTFEVDTANANAQYVEIGDSYRDGMTYRAQVTSGAQGVFQIKAIVDGKPATSQPLTLTFTGGVNSIDYTNGNISSSDNVLQANDTATITVTYTPVDVAGQAIKGIASQIALTATDESVAFTAQPFTESTDGIYVTTLKGSVTGDLVAAVTDATKANLYSDYLYVTMVSDIAKKVSVAKSTLSVDKAQADADGADVITVTLVAKDSSGATITGIASGLGLFEDGLAIGADTTVTAFVEGATGTYTATICTSTAGSHKLDLTQDGKLIAGTNFGGIDIEFKQHSTSNPGTGGNGKTPDAGQSTFAINGSATTVASDGVANVLLKLAIKDASGAEVTGLTPTYIVTPSTGYRLKTPSPKVGEYDQEFTATVPGTFSIQPQINGANFGTAVSITATAVLSEANSTASLSPVSGEFVANGIDKAVLTYTLKDNASVPAVVTDAHTVAFEAQGSHTGLTIGQVTGSAGIYTAEITSTAAIADVTIQIKVDNKAVAQTVVVHAKAPTLDLGKSTLTAEHDNTESVTLVFTAKDQSGSPFKGLTGVVFKGKKSTTTITAATETSTGSGIWKATATATANDTFTVSVESSTGPIALTSTALSVTVKAPVLIVPPAPSAANSSVDIDVDYIKSDASDHATITITVKDDSASKVAMSGLAAQLAITSVKGATTATISAVTAGTGAGVYTGTITAVSGAADTVLDDIKITYKGGGFLSLTKSLTINATGASPSAAPPVPTFFSDSPDSGDVSTFALPAPSTSDVVVVSSAFNVGDDVTLGGNDILAIYVDDGDASLNRKIDIQPHPDMENYWVLVLKEVSLDGSEKILESVAFALSPDASDDMGLPAYLPIKLQNNKSRLRALAAKEADFPVGYMGFKDQSLLGGSDGDMDSLLPTDYYDALNTLASSMVNYTAVLGLGIYDPNVLHRLAEHALDVRVDMFCDIKPSLNPLDAIAAAANQNFGGFYNVCRYHFPYSSKDPITGAQVVYGLSGDAFTAKAKGVQLVADVGGWHYSPAGYSRGMLNRTEITPLPGAAGIDREAYVAARINPVAVGSDGSVMIDDALTTWAKNNYLRFQHVPSILNAIARMAYDVAQQLKHEPDGVTRAGLTRDLTALLERFVAAEALVKPRDPSQGENPFVVEVTQGEFDFWNVRIYVCPTGVARRIAIEPILFR